MKDVDPVHYKIRLEPDLRSFMFSGSTEILVEAIEPVNEILLNILELAVWNCKVRVDDDFVDCPFSVYPKKEVLKISLPTAMAGKIDLKIDYVGQINNKMAGFYRSKYVAGGEERYVAVTQFEESDARRAFPCFDHPVKKATFDVEMIIDEKLVAISNAPIEEERPLGDGRKRVRFHEMPKMSTYLLFFGVGEFEFIEDPGEVVIRVATMPGMTDYGKFGMAFGRKCLQFSEDYYGIGYPIPKLDLIAIADFAAGAMENWGAITFRENLLLHFPDSTSKAGEERICGVIAHEIAHQWFGNLVTPSDWKYLWLNESFATYFGYGVVHYLYPEWNIWDQFLHGQTDTALDRDALLETFPIEIPGGEHLVINVSTAPIIYNKGGSILRQVEGYVGKENFKKGLRHYLKKHEYACASSHHLWEALEEVSEKPITKMMRLWIEKPGFPVVEVKREEDQLALTQKRFTYMPDESNQVWMVPLSIKVFYESGHSRIVNTLLEDESTTIDMGTGAVAYKVNYRQTGFYRVRYLEKSDLQELGKRVESKELDPEDRWGLENDLYAMVKRDDVSVDDYLDFLSNYSDEGSFLPLMSIAGNLFHAYLVLGESKKVKVSSIGKSLFGKVLQQIGCEPNADEKHTTSILRDQIMWHAVLYGLEDVAQFAIDKFSSLIRGEKVHPDIAKSIMQVGALNGTRETLEWFDNRFQSSESEHDRMNILAALGSFKDKALIQEIQKYILAKVPHRNKFIPIAYMAANPHAIPDLWEWYLDNLEELEQFHPIHYERAITAIVPIGGIGKEEQIQSFFSDYMGKKPKAQDAIKLALEKLKINAGMRAR